jgi:hypothetical protein
LSTLEEFGGMILANACGVSLRENPFHFPLLNDRSFTRAGSNSFLAMYWTMG